MDIRSIIKEIHYGNVSHVNIKLSEVVSEHYGNLADMQDELKANLSPEQYEMVVKMIDAIEFKNCDEVAQHYAEGFKVCVLVGIEYSDKE